MDTPAEPVAPAPVNLRLGRGDRLVVERHRTDYDFVGRSYYLMSRELSAKLPHLGLTLTQYDLLHHLMGTQESGGIVRQTQQAIGEALGIQRKDVGKAMQRLTEIGLVWQERRGEYRINPRCAFYGRSGEQRAAVESIPEHVPELNLPDYQVRPPRRRRNLKGDAS
ncbi:MarR family winged helix-turn-helix transcriptional regulator [Nocardiopsis dassonvillei]|uniref:MarR family winged helix-turn-helix transcriptional regulator n=1 Tax=Nocardiopsis dassonvillei TaxID=2014 RepID=UPI0033C52372